MTTRPVRPAARPSRPAAGSKFSLGFFQEIYVELRKKVTWPSREEATNLTAIVLIVSAAVGLFLGLVDYGFTQLISLLLLR